MLTVIWKELTHLKEVNLGKIRKTKNIEIICRAVIAAVEGGVIVRIDENELAQRKVKNKRGLMAYQSDDEIWINGATIRWDLSSKKWKDHPPHGWAWFEIDRSGNDQVLGMIYQTPDNRHEIYMKKTLADHPVGASLLIKAMKEKLKKLI